MVLFCRSNNESLRLRWGLQADAALASAWGRWELDKVRSTGDRVGIPGTPNKDPLANNRIHRTRISFAASSRLTDNPMFLGGLGLVISPTYNTIFLSIQRLYIIFHH